MTIVEAREVDKRFGGVHALRGASLSFAKGSIHGLVGENGAGKSTLAKILAGVERPTRGAVVFDGELMNFRSPRDALAKGITLIAQELALEPKRPVFENVMLGTEPRIGTVIRRRAMLERFRALSESAGFDLDPKALVGSLRQADQQKVEILRAVARDAQVLIMDEPTAALSGDEVEKMWAFIATLRDAGKTIIVVSHFLDEVLRVCDTVTVLRDGNVILTEPSSALTIDELVTAMVGRSLADSTPKPPRVPADARTVLEVKNLSNAHLRDVSLTVRAGEIVGIAGLVGSGRTELARAIFAVDKRDGGSEITVDGDALTARTPRGAIRAGVAMIPESRKKEGLVLGRSTAENVSLPHLGTLTRLGVVQQRAEKRMVAAALAETGVRESAGAEPVRGLSGGNQQKALFAKWLLDTPKLLIADEPTRGVDVGSKLGIYELLVGLAERGMAVLVISSEMEEVIALSNRVVVMRGGEVVGELAGRIEEQSILRLAFGLGEAASERSRGEGVNHG